MEEGDREPTGICPHCGAGGRWIHVFLCDDGLIYGAMSGCINLFGEASNSRLAIMGERAIAKETASIRDLEYRGRTTPIASWFRNVLDALRDLELGTITLEEAERIGNHEYFRRATWLRDNGYSR